MTDPSPPLSPPPSGNHPKERTAIRRLISSARPRPLRGLAVLAVVVAAGATATGCGSSGSSSSGSRLQQSCTTVTNVLADGPDPDADPVGYAEAQILPLRQLTVSDAALQKAVTNLAAAYQSYSADNGGGQTAVAVDAAQNAINAICPGAAQ